MTKILDATDAVTIFDQNGVVGKQLLKQNKVEYVYLSFAPDAETQAHVQDILMTFYIANGKGEVIVDDKSIEIAKGQLVEIPAGASRQWKNTGKDILELFVVKVMEKF